jgi:hypothetical protein
MQAEPGDYFQRPSRIMFGICACDYKPLATRPHSLAGDWINQYKVLAAGQPTENILPLELFPVGQDDQIAILMRAFGQLPEVVTYWLRMSFQRVLKYKVHKLQASGVDLGSSILFKTRLGFSGTTSDLVPSDMGQCGFEPGCDASVLRVMTNPSVMSHHHLETGWDMLKLLQYVAQSQRPRFHALIDTGALITGMDNKDVAGSWVIIYMIRMPTILQLTFSSTVVLVLIAACTWMSGTARWSSIVQEW